MTRSATTIFLVLLVTATGKAQTSGAIATAGSWMLNMEKSTFNPGPAPLQQAERYATADGGFIIFTLSRVTGDGIPGFVQAAFKLDGESYPVYTNLNVPGLLATEVQPTLSAIWRQVDSYTVQIIIEDGGEPIDQTTTLVVSRDGMTLTKTVRGTTPQGGPMENLYVYDRIR